VSDPPRLGMQRPKHRSIARIVLPVFPDVQLTFALASHILKTKKAAPVTEKVTRAALLSL